MPSALKALSQVDLVSKEATVPVCQSQVPIRTGSVEILDFQEIVILFKIQQLSISYTVASLEMALEAQKTVTMECMWSGTEVDVGGGSNVFVVLK